MYVCKFYDAYIVRTYISFSGTTAFTDCIFNKLDNDKKVCTRTFMCVDINHVSQHNSVNTICNFVIVEESPMCTYN